MATRPATGVILDSAEQGGHARSRPDWDTICPGCNASLNALPAGILAQLRTKDTAYAAASRAPAAKIAA